MEFQGVKQCVIIGSFSTEHGQELSCAYIVPMMTKDHQRGFDQEQFQTLKEYVKARVSLESMTLDGGIRIMDELPMTRCNKVDQYKLRKVAHEELDNENDA